jgi:hypothetical protein
MFFYKKSPSKGVSGTQGSKKLEFPLTISTSIIKMKKNASEKNL